MKKTFFSNPKKKSGKLLKGIWFSLTVFFAIGALSAYSFISNFRDPIKTLEIFIAQDTVAGAVPNWTAGAVKNYDVFLGELDATNTKNVTKRNAYVDITGTGIASGAWTMQVQVNSETAVTYNFPTTGGNPTHFHIIYNVSALNYDYPGSSSANNTLAINFPSAPTSVALLSAKQVFTYDHD